MKKENANSNSKVFLRRQKTFIRKKENANNNGQVFLNNNDKEKETQQNNKVFLWKRKTLTRHDLVADKQVGLPSDWPPKNPKLHNLRPWK